MNTRIKTILGAVGGAIVIAIILIVAIPKEKSIEVIETPVIETEEVVLPEIEGPTIVSVEKDTIKGSFANVITQLSMYNIKVNTVQLDLYGGDFQLMVGFEHNDMSYYVRSAEVETLEEFMSAIDDMMVKVEDIVY